MTKKFVVAYINFFDNELTQEVIFASCPEEAMIKKLMGAGFEFEIGEEHTEDSIKEFAFNADIMISAFEIQT